MSAFGNIGSELRAAEQLRRAIGVKGLLYSEQRQWLIWRPHWLAFLPFAKDWGRWVPVGGSK